MHHDEALLTRLKGFIEQKLGWGASAGWVNQDFIALSRRIQQETGGTISHVTLKRIWGKVKYDGMPQVYTLNVLSQFAGFESWRDLIVKQSAPQLLVPGPAEPAPAYKNARFTRQVAVWAAVIGCVFTVLIVIAASRKKIDPQDYTFSSHTTNGASIPNSVVFDYNALKSPDDSVIIQQSWDKRLRTVVGRNQHQHTLIYYYPGFFQPKLIVSGQVVREHKLLIPSNGWVAAVMRSPIPVYFPKQEVTGDGHLSLSAAKIKAQNIPLGPDAPSVSFCNVHDFGPIFTDDFQFETAVRNDFHEGSSVCQLTNIYLLGEGTAISIPLAARGCESALNFFFTDFTISGKQKDLSVFGVDFNKYVKVRIRSAGGKAEIYLDDRLVYTVDHDITHTRIIGIDYVFQGTGSVDYARLSNGKVAFDDEF